MFGGRNERSRWRTEGRLAGAACSPAAADLSEDEGASRERRARREDGMREEGGREGGEGERAEWRGRRLDEGRKRGKYGEGGRREEGKKRR